MNAVYKIYVNILFIPLFPVFIYQVLFCIFNIQQFVHSITTTIILHTQSFVVLNNKEKGKKI